jgi:hypothetical protein
MSYLRLIIPDFEELLNLGFSALSSADGTGQEGAYVGSWTTGGVREWGE